MSRVDNHASWRAGYEFGYHRGWGHGILIGALIVMVGFVITLWVMAGH